MAAGAWAVYNEAKKKIGNSTLSLAATAFRLTLHTSASNANTATLSIYNELDNQVAEGNGYSSSGKALTGEVWTVGASAGQYKFDADDVVFTATGGTIPNIKFASIWISAAASANRFLLCRSQLTSSQFTLASGNTLTSAMNSSGILTLA
jgi:hypothetical protein